VGAGEASQFVSRCTFLDTIKEHPYGATYIVEERDTHELYVIKKIVKRETGLKEARLLSRLKHPHIVNIFGAGEDQDQAVVLMQYARGGSLSDRLVRRMPHLELVALLRACLDGLDFAHKNHILHGNVRPSNILISKDQTPWLSDFGLPEHYGRDSGNWYGAPEGKKSVQSDVYSMGVVAYQLLTNQLPEHDRRGRISFAGLGLEATTELQQILEGMLERDPARRYASCREVMEDLDLLLKPAERFPGKWLRTALEWRHHKMGWNDWLLGFLSGLAAAGLITYVLGWLDQLFAPRP
jgi:serine/threonine-protein kinase